MLQRFEGLSFGQYKMETADCRPGTKCRMQTRYKMQTEYVYVMECHFITCVTQSSFFMNISIIVSYSKQSGQATVVLK